MVLVSSLIHQIRPFYCISSEWIKTLRKIRTFETMFIIVNKRLNLRSGVKWPLKRSVIVIYFKTKHNINLIWSLVSLCMSCEFPLRFVSFLALVALEWSRHHVRSHVGFQMARVGGSIVALVTSEWPFSCMLLHHVNFQMTSCNARILAHCASVWLFTRVCLLVSL